VSALGLSVGQLGKRWVCKVVSWSRWLCQRLVCIGQLTCFGSLQPMLKSSALWLKEHQEILNVLCNGCKSLLVLVQ